MELKFYKKTTRPSNIGTGSIWFNPSTKRIELITGATTSDVYGSDIQDATYSSYVLTITKIDGSETIIDLTEFASYADLTLLENSLASKLNKIKVNNTTVNSTSLNLVGSGGTTVSNSNGTITISSDEVPTTFDASAITSGTIDLDRLPKGALERLFIVANETAAMSADCQEGDTVQVTGNSNKMYFCVNESATTFATKFHEYTAGTATSVPWSGVTDKPTIPTKTSQLTNDSGYLTSAPVTSVNGQTGDVTVENSEPLVYESSTLNGFKSLLSYDDMQTAISNNRDVILKFESKIYKLSEYALNNYTSYFYFSYANYNTVYTIIATWKSGTNFNASGSIVSYEHVIPELATTSTAGTVKIGDNISVSSGTISVSTATSSTLGVVKVGSGLSISSGTISVDSSSYQTKLVSGTSIKTINGSSILGSGNISISSDIPIATSTSLGKIMVPTSGNLTIDSSGNISVGVATGSALGVVKIGDNLSVYNGLVSVPKAKSSVLGVVKPGTGLNISNDGTLSVYTSDLDSETWTFTLEDGSTVTKTILLQ